MSAFLVSHTHINALIVFAVSRGNMLGSSGNLMPTEAGQMLLRENVRSLVSRYDADTTEGYEQEICSYVYRVKRADLIQTPIAVIKLCDCYDYQACETTDYYDTQAGRLISRIRKEAIRLLPGYDEAPWCLE